MSRSVYFGVACVVFLCVSAIIVQAYGPNSAALAPALAGESKALRALGRSVEADDIERRMQTLKPLAPGQMPAMGPTR